MRRILSGLTVAVLLTVLSGGIARANDGRHCDPRLLDGLYVFTASGFNITPTGGSVPKAIVELLRFHGDGTVTTPYTTVSINGTPITSAPGGSGTYTVAALDPPEAVCTGILRFSDAPNPSFNLVIAPHADRVWLLQTSPPAVFEGHAVKVSH